MSPLAAKKKKLIFLKSLVKRLWNKLLRFLGLRKLKKDPPSETTPSLLIGCGGGLALGAEQLLAPVPVAQPLKLECL